MTAALSTLRSMYRAACDDGSAHRESLRMSLEALERLGKSISSGNALNAEFARAACHDAITSLKWWKSEPDCNLCAQLMVSALNIAA